MVLERMFIFNESIDEHFKYMYANFDSLTLFGLSFM